LEAEAQGRGLDGERAALGLGALQALVPPVPPVLVLLAQAAVLLQPHSAAGAGPLGVGDRLLNLLGMVVGGLATAAAGLGLAGDGTRGAEEDGRGIAEAGEQG
jgi:hypothetical protein